MSKTIETKKSVQTQKSNTMQTQKNFSVKDYLGKWYEIAKIPNPWETGCKLSTAKYTADWTDPNAILINNKCYDKAGRLIRTNYGRARIPDVNDKSKLAVKFLGSHEIANKPEADYWVLSTNYHSYSFVGDRDKKYLWILSRDKNVPLDHLPILISQVEKLGYDSDKVITNSKRFF